MDGRLFDDMARSVAAERSRRAVLRGLVAAAVGAFGIAAGRRTGVAAASQADPCAFEGEACGVDLGIVCCDGMVCTAPFGQPPACTRCAIQGEACPWGVPCCRGLRCASGGPYDATCVPFEQCAVEGEACGDGLSCCNDQGLSCRFHTEIGQLGTCTSEPAPTAPAPAPPAPAGEAVQALPATGVGPGGEPSANSWPKPLGLAGAGIAVLASRIRPSTRR